MEDTRFAVSVHIMTALANSQDELMSSENLSVSLKTNPAFIRKLIARLVDAKLIESFRGKGGGIKLAKKPSEICLRDIYLASTDNKPFVCTPNKPSEKNCIVSCAMGDILQDVVQGMEAASLSYLSKISLSDLLSKVKKSSSKRS